MNKFYETEQPELVSVISGEFRLYRSGQRLAVSKPQFTDNDGQKRIGKTVSIDLAANKGNQELIRLLQSAIEILQTDNSAQDNK